MDEAPIRPIEKKNDATKRMRVRFTKIASFIFGEGRHLHETHGNIKVVPPARRRSNGAGTSTWRSGFVSPFPADGFPEIGHQHDRADNKKEQQQFHRMGSLIRETTSCLGAF
jgi:hypothetical protein